MNLKYIFFGLLLYLHYQIDKCNSVSITYMSTERPTVSWFDTKYFNNFTLRSRRLGRQDPKHYVELYADVLFTVDNRLKADFYFYQFLTNRYRPSFVEMHMTLCEMLHSDAVFGSPLKKALGDRDCPLPPGEYLLENMTIPYVPNGFPFNKGRIYCNISITDGGGTKKLIASGNIDLEIKVAKIKNT